MACRENIPVDKTPLRIGRAVEVIVILCGAVVVCGAVVFCDAVMVCSAATFCDTVVVHDAVVPYEAKLCFLYRSKRRE